MNFNNVKMDEDGIFINGESKIIICSSLFYFRIPRGLWLDRLKKVKDAGYNCIDVYFPWNYHELGEEKWDFSGERDIEEFLQMANDMGLWVCARPGPYICSEWDGGGLPAYLFAKDNLIIRDFNEDYLRYVEKWYSKIIDILSKFQINQGGSIIVIQLENELDFFNCRNPKAYMEALRDMALKYGATVPLIACAGQGDIGRACGNADGVIPTVNFYPDINDKTFESKAIFYYEQLKERNTPVCVTETHRTHFLLKRILSCGAKFIGPYNQVGGTDFGFTTAVNNWGNPVAFLTTDYDFGSMISPSGELTDEYFEGRLFASMINCLDEALASAKPSKQTDIQIITEFETANNAPYILHLNGGGYLVAIPNLCEKAGNAIVNYKNKRTTFNVKPNSCPMVLIDTPLKIWGLDGTINYCTAEIIKVQSFGNKTYMVLYGENQCEISFALPNNDEINISLDFTRQNEKEIDYKDGRILIIISLPKKQAQLFIDIDECGKISYLENKFKKGTPPTFEWSTTSIENPLFDASKQLNGDFQHLEKAGFLRGFGWYGATVNTTHAVQGLFLQNASDVVSVYCNKNYLGTVTPNGGCLFMPTELDGNLDISLRTEIWGHSNFDDCRLPALEIKSLKGVGGLGAIYSNTDICSNWHFVDVDGESCYDDLDLKNCAIMSWTGWNVAKKPLNGWYCKTFNPQENIDFYALHFPDFKSKGTVYVNGINIGEINPLNPYIVISDNANTNEKIEVAILLEMRYYNEYSGKVYLMQGKKATANYIAGNEESGLWEKAKSVISACNPVNMPLTLNSGETLWLFGKCTTQSDLYECCDMFVQGENVKLTVFLNGHIVSRLWLNSTNRPAFTGGSQDRIYLPSVWFEETQNTIAILVEAIEKENNGVIKSIILK